ncbi:MAG: hypothetical protein HOW97_23340 [Catenulispora sp.]|nr:hypothetical protein [Catenulispora sp.]
MTHTHRAQQPDCDICNRLDQLDDVMNRLPSTPAASIDTLRREALRCLAEDPNAAEEAMEQGTTAASGKRRSPRPDRRASGAATEPDPAGTLSTADRFGLAAVLVDRKLRRRGLLRIGVITTFIEVVRMIIDR